jgi:hypothetical protein
MPFGTAMARLKTALDELDTNVRADMRAKPPVTDKDRRAMRSEIETCLQRLDELRTLLAG